MRPTLVSVNLRLSAAELDFHVDVALRSFDDRWLAVADIAGDKEIGLGRTARSALAASLATLGAQAVDRFLADPQLLALSRRAL